MILSDPSAKTNTAASSAQFSALQESPADAFLVGIGDLQLHGNLGRRFAAFAFHGSLVRPSYDLNVVFRGRHKGEQDLPRLGILLAKDFSR
jgi:hypothetical protein